MKPDRYETSRAGRRRLSGLIQSRGSRMGIPTWAGILFGTPFVAAGTAIILVGMKILPVDPGSVHAPYWVLVVAGVSFVLGGFMVWGMAGKQLAADRQRRSAARQYPDEPALADYHWHPSGFEVSEWAGAAKAVGMALGLTVFLSLFNWWAFVAHGPWSIKILVLLFDCVAVAVWWEAVRRIGCAFRFGYSRIVFTRFPYALSEAVVIRWRPGGGVNQVNQGTFVLRCVAEWMESRGTGRNRTRSLVHEEIWSGKWMVEQPRNFQVNGEIELRYELPPDAQSTNLSADKPVFWELEAKLDLPGFDFRATYLVPIYAAKAAQMPMVPASDSRRAL